MNEYEETDKPLNNDASPLTRRDVEMILENLSEQANDEEPGVLTIILQFPGAVSIPKNFCVRTSHFSNNTLTFRHGRSLPLERACIITFLTGHHRGKWVDGIIIDRQKIDTNTIESVVEFSNAGVSEEDKLQT